MDAAVWISVLAGVIAASIAIWIVLIQTSIGVDPGTLALLLKRGKATSRVLEPGRHFIQPWRKAMVQVYPSRELALVAGGPVAGDQSVEYPDEPLRLHLGDKTAACVSYTVRCQLDLSKVKEVHNQFGPDGIWPALRDTTRRTLIAAASDPDVTIGDVFGDGFSALEQRFAGVLGDALAEMGFALTMFSLREIDLGETGDVIQSTLRADVELQREQALAEVRKARLENDASLSGLLGDVDTDVMLRYRQIEALAQILERWGGDRPIPAALAATATTAGPASPVAPTGSTQDSTEAKQEADVASDAP
jgi:regulator of protease activity HflC (stomatin/prohibitin superfamily)